MTNPINTTSNQWVFSDLPVSGNLLWDSIGRDPETVRRCLRAGIKPDICRNLITPLVAACKARDFQSMKYLIAHDANINFIYFFTEEGFLALRLQTILIEMCGKDYEHPMCDEMIQWILEDGADTSIKDLAGNTALHLAARYKGIRTMRILLENRADPNAQNDRGETPFMVFLSRKSRPDIAETVQLFLQKGVDFSLLDINKNHLIHYAAAARVPQLVTKLLENQVDQNLQNNEGMTLLMLVCNGLQFNLDFFENSEESIDTADLLLKAGADLSLQDKEGNTALHYAAAKRCPRLALKFLQNGADANARNNEQETPLMNLGQVFSGEPEYKPEFQIQIMHHLRDYNAILDLCDDLGRVALFDLTPYPEVFRELLRFGANPNLPNNEGVTLLGDACYYQRPDEQNFQNIQSLLIYNADPNVKHKDLGITALDAELQRTSRGGWRTSRRIVRVLLEAGATKNIEDSPLIEEIQTEIRKTRNSPDSPWVATTKSQIRNDYNPKRLFLREIDWRWERA